MHNDKIMIVGEARETPGKLQQILRNEGWECPASNMVTLENLEYQLAAGSPDLTFLALGDQPESVLQILSSKTSLELGHVVAVGSGNNAGLVIEAMRAGAHDFVDETGLESEILNALDRYQKAQRTRKSRGKVIGCLPACGGAGTTTIAVNLACYLSQLHQSAALLEMRRRSGDAALLLDLQPEHSIADLCRNLSKLDETFFESLLCSHPAGVELLAGPHHYRDGEMVTGEGMVEALRMAQDYCPTSVLDLDHPQVLPMEDLLPNVDLLLLIVRPEFAALHNARDLMSYLDDLGLPREKLRIVANRYTGKYDIPQKQIEEILRVESVLLLPEDAKHVTIASNRGVPAVINQRGCQFTRQLKALGDELEKVEAEAGELMAV